MKNANALRNELAAVFNGLRTGTVDVKDAAELANIAGKMIKSATAQVEYYSLLKVTPRIAFLDEDEPDAS